MSSFCPSHHAIFAELDRLVPGRPFLALGQTAFWDEPMKGGLALCAKALGFERRFVAGIHDTDYFARHPGVQASGYVALPHNDTTTRGLWSAAGEFSALFGSETVITRDLLRQAGFKSAKVTRARPGILDSMTEAFGWRGVAFAGEDAKVIAETPMRLVGSVLIETLDWAIEETLKALPECLANDRRARAEELKAMVCDAACADESASVGQFFRRVLPPLYNWVAGQPIDVEATQTSELLRLNTQTAGLPRFKLLDRFLNPTTRGDAVEAYNSALKGSEAYTLDRFGSWALPFDVVIPRVGRGTLRVARRGLIVMTPKPVAITTKKPIESVGDLARVLSERFGPDCVVVGKAISLIGMLAEEFVFVFHEGASGYVKQVQAFHQGLRHRGIELSPSPILRVKYQTWSTLEHCKVWLRMPEPLRQPFGADELSSSSFSARWPVVRRQQTELLEKLSQLKRPLELIRFLAENYAHSWAEQARQYEKLNERLEKLHVEIDALRAQKAEALQRWRLHKAERAKLERALGEHWRAKIFERQPSEADLVEREQQKSAIHGAAQRTSAALAEWRRLQATQDELVASPTVQEAHQRRRDLELEAELKRLKLVRQAVTASKGLARAEHRPSAWWFPIMCPDGGWLRQTVNTAEYYLEPL